MNVIERLPRPVIIAVFLGVLLGSGFIIYRTVNDIVTNNGYGTREEIMKRQAAGQGRGRTAPARYQQKAK